jgi:hypothetical protein
MLSLLMTSGFTLVACLIGSRFPDWIAFDRHPGHRGFGHSLLSLFIFALIALIASGYFVDQGLAVLYAVALAAVQLLKLFAGLGLFATLLSWIAYGAVRFLGCGIGLEPALSAPPRRVI